MKAASRVAAFERARAGVRRTALRHQLQAVVTGKSRKLSLVLDERGGDVASVIHQVSRRLNRDSLEMQRLVLAFHQAGITQAVVDRLASNNASERKRSARIVGSIYMDSAVTWLAPLVMSRERSLSDAAARALGRIGGARSAEALLGAIQRTGLRRILIGELARAAPDLFLEVAMTERQPQRPVVVPAAAIAAGLRRRHTAIGPLLALLMHGDPRERAISCRSLGWIGSASAASVLAAALEDPDWKVRMSAAKALGAVRAELATPNLERLLGDRNPRVHKAALTTLRRLTGSARGWTTLWL